MSKRAHTLIAEHFGMDARDVYEGRYQDTVTRTSIFVIDGDYYAASKEAPREEVGMPWARIGEVDGRGIWESKAEGEAGRMYSDKQH